MSSIPQSESLAAQQVFSRALEPLLGNQLDRLRRRYFVHGVAFSLLLPALAIALFFTLDHTLRLPVAIRLLHTVVVFAVLGVALARFVAYPLSRRFSPLDIAQVLERTFPELHQRMVSAVQLQQASSADLRNQSAAMIDQLVAETAAAAGSLPLDRFFDPRRTRRIGLAAGGALLLLTAGVIASPITAKTFLLRHLGIQADYPRQTYLTVDLPPSGPELQRTDGDGVTELLLPAGGELHVSVLAEGVVPKEVFLDVTALRGDDGDSDNGRNSRSVAMAPRPGDRFRYVFRKISGSFEFHARGGDDDDGDLLVRVRTIRPPQIANIRAVVQPPAYTGIARLEQTGGAVEALVGSGVELMAATTGPVQKATMVFLESGRRIELEPTTIQDDSGAATAYRAEFTVLGSDRYQIELLGGTGLRNPNPGTYPISGLQDYAPVGRWLLPGDETALLLPDALLCVRAEVRDDFGLAAVDLAIERAGAEVRGRSLLGNPTAGDPTTRAVLTELFEVKELLGAGSSGAGRTGDGLSLLLTITDNCSPAPGSVELPRRIVQIVDPQQLAESIAKAFRRLREETSQALDIQIDRRLRLEELAQREGVSALETAQQLSAVEVGQSRVLGSCERLHQGLMTAFDVHLWNRLETSPNAAIVIDLYREFSQNLDAPVAQAPDFYRSLVQRRQSGTLGALETALDPILQMIAIADRLATAEVPAAARSLSEAQVARPDERQAFLQQAIAQQQSIAEALQLLLNRLEEWNDYQDTVQEARALRDRQRDLQLRTEELRGIKK